MMDLYSLNRKELQALAKQHGLKANQSNAVLIEALSSIVEDTKVEEPKEAPEQTQQAEQPIQATVVEDKKPVEEKVAPVVEPPKEVDFAVRDKVKVFVDDLWMVAEIKRINKSSYRVILESGEEKTVKPSEIKLFEEVVVVTPATEVETTIDLEEETVSAPICVEETVVEQPEDEVMTSQNEICAVETEVAQEPIAENKVDEVEAVVSFNSPMVEASISMIQSNSIMKISFPTEEELNNDASRHSICMMIDDLLDFDALEDEAEVLEEADDENLEPQEQEKEEMEEEAVSTDEIDAILSQVMEDEEEDEETKQPLEILPESLLMESIMNVLQKDDKEAEEEALKIPTKVTVPVHNKDKQRPLFKARPSTNIQPNKGQKRSLDDDETRNAKNPFDSVVQQHVPTGKKAKIVHGNKPLSASASVSSLPATNNKMKITTPSYQANTTTSSNKRGSMNTPARPVFTPKSAGAALAQKQKDGSVTAKKQDGVPKGSKSVDATKTKTVPSTTNSLSQSKQKTTPVVKSFLPSSSSGGGALTASTGFALTSAFLNKDAKVKFATSEDINSNDENDVKKINRVVSTATTTTSEGGNPTKRTSVSTPNFKKMHDKQFHGQKSISSLVSRKSEVASKMEDAYAKAITNETNM